MDWFWVGSGLVPGCGQEGPGMPEWVLARFRNGPGLPQEGPGIPGYSIALPILDPGFPAGLGALWARNLGGTRPTCSPKLRDPVSIGI
jgi:hypothetical protein